jgi:hypothetical protein
MLVSPHNHTMFDRVWLGNKIRIDELQLVYYFFFASLVACMDRDTVNTSYQEPSFLLFTVHFVPLNWYYKQYME